MIRKVLFCLLTMILPMQLHALESLPEQEMSDVSGGQGIALQLDFFYNMTPDSSKSSVPNNDAAPFDATCGTGGPGTTGNPCRFGLQFANRTADWLVFKDFYMGARIFQINLDGANLATAASNSAYFDATKFQNSAGTCLLPSALCTVANLNTLNAIVFSYPATTTAYNTSTFVSSGYNSLLLTANLGRLVVEANAGAGPPDTTQNSYLGARILDNNSKFAGVAIRGKAFVFGF